MNFEYKKSSEKKKSITKKKERKYEFNDVIGNVRDVAL